MRPWASAWPDTPRARPTSPARVWTDWLLSVEEGLALLRGVTDQVFLIGQSMGGMIALVAATRYPVDGVIALSNAVRYGRETTAARRAPLLPPAAHDPESGRAGPRRRLPNAGKRSTRPTRCSQPLCIREVDLLHVRAP